MQTTTHRTTGRRRSLRRAVTIDCALRSSLWSGELSLPATDLSVTGIWVETPIALSPGEEVIVSFTPPRCMELEKVWAAARVARIGVSRYRSEAGVLPGMGLQFMYCSDRHLRVLARALAGCPPRLPVRRLPPPLPVA
ncbi:MAG: PilZ domain-containing protein [Polyangiales bacterium]